MENIAIVGIANLFPGSKTPDEFWQNLQTKTECRSPATEKQMGVNPESYFGKKGETDKYYCMHGGYVSDFEFDASPFLVDDGYLNDLDDIFKWTLYVAKTALEDAGYWGSETLARCGAILGNLSFPTKSSNQLFLPLYHQLVDDALKHVINSDFQLSHYIENQTTHPDNALIAGYPSSLLAKATGLGGSHFSLDAACASSCYSVKLACDYLHTGKADLMLAGAVSAADPMFVNMGFSIFQAYPGNGISAPLDKNSQGLFAGEGAGMMLLKRHSDAVRDGDKIYALIKGGALSNDGKGEFVLSPNTKGQVLAYERAYQDAEVNPAEIAYVECHATGTPKGDKVELGSMETFFSRYSNKPVIGSVKSNVGHLLTAAGMPGMTKAIWSMNHGQIPGTPNITDPQSSKTGYFNGEHIPTDMIDWPRPGVKRAGVSVFGFGGSNAHIVLQEASTQLEQSQQQAKAPEPLAIIGMDAHFGAADSLQAFGDVAEGKKSILRDLPVTRWKGIEQNDAVMNALRLPKAPKGAYIENFDIDFIRFKVPPNEQDALIPQQLLMMKVADNAAKDAQLKEGGNVAVLVAMGVELELHQYRGRVNLATQIEQSLLEQGIVLTAEQQAELTNIAKDGVAQAAQLNQYTSFIGNIMASRISALWDFSGPAFTVSAEENSVYRCVELAESLFQTSDVEAVIVAAVDLSGSAENISLRQQFGPIATDTNGYADVLSSRGWLPGEGAGAFVLKPASQVTANQAYAHVNSMGFCNGSDVNAVNQASSVALQSAGVDPIDISLLEAHASGFAHENEAEKQCFTQLYPHLTADSVKRHVGHGFAASGAASIIKTALQLNQSGAQYAAISGMGRDDSCVHMILSGPQASRVAPVIEQSSRKQLIKTIVLGGDNIYEKISANAASLAALKSQVPVGLANITTPVNLENIQAGRFDLETSLTTKEITTMSDTQKPQLSLVSSTGSEQPVASAAPAQVASAPANYGSVPATVNQAAQAHKAYLENAKTAQQDMAKLIAMQAQLLSGQPLDPNALNTTVNITPAAKTVNVPGNVPSSVSAPVAASPVAKAVQTAFEPKPIQLVERFNKPDNIIYNTADLVEFAEGDISKVFGPEYAPIDNNYRRVRLPTTDYLLVTRVTDLDAKIHEYKPSYMATEYDIPTDAPFLIDGQIPWSVSVESGQCDLMLISYLGIDFKCNGGERVYRLLDCQLTFLEDMAYGGETLRYEIHIDSYAKNGDQFLFFFHYDCYVNGKKVLIMRNGCAGFFTDQELDEGKGVIHNDKDKAEIANAVKSSFTPLIQNQRSTPYEYDDMMKLVNGDIAGCFGPEYDQGGYNPSLKFSSKKFLMIERVTKIDRTGGPWGLGVLEGEKRLEPEHWYFPCHFKDDQVMAGSLMSEGCGQLAMFFMLWLGMHKDVKNARFQPVFGEAQTVRCRGQVTPQSNTLTYRMTVTEMGMEPHPYMKANIDIILDGRTVVDFKNLSVQIKEQDPSHPYAAELPPHLEYAGNQFAQQSAAAVSPAVEVASEQVVSEQAAVEPANVDSTGKDAFANVDAPLMWVESNTDVPKIKGVTPIKHFEAPMPTDPARQNRVPNKTPFTPWHMFEFATGNISKCFGPDFDVYEGRIPPRTPCGDLQLVTQVLDVKGERGDLKNVSSCVAEYEVPHDAWFFTKNTYENWMPYSILMEISLQPNGFISGYMGTTLKYPEKDLFFRNLDGTGKLLKQVDLRGKTITNKSVMLSTSIAGGSIIQSFTFELLTDGETFYEGTAVFGYFSGDALANQLGIDNGKTTYPWFVDNNTPKNQLEVINLRDDNLPMYSAPAGKPHYRLAGGQMNFVDTVTVVEGGGSEGKGYILGERTIDPTDWFFRYHFHQDPVMPGSLGVEAIIELLQVYALKNDLGAGFKNPRFIAPLSTVAWKYRGQITPENKQMSLDVHITDIRKEDGQVTVVGNANLSKDGLRIYQVKDIVLSIVEADA